MATARRELEELVRLMGENIGEELYLGDEEDGRNNRAESSEEEVDYYRTQYIEWEAKEMVDFVSNDNDSG